VCWSIVRKEKPALRSSFSGAFPSDCTPKVTKEDNVNVFIHSFTFRDEVIIIGPAANFGGLSKATMHAYI
jgi:hypothetical protein